MGATLDPQGGVHFTLWSDKAAHAAVVLYDADGWEIWEEPLTRDSAQLHVFSTFLDRARLGSMYKFKLDGESVSDPFARSFPFGPRGPAEVLAPLTPREQSKRAIDLARGEVIYELHVGTFTTEGTFESATQRLQHLQELGITVIELMPLASFPGDRGWGYDGVGLFAPFARYGTLQQLCAFLDAAHARDMGVILDVVYNHLGPEGNVLPRYSDLYFHPERQNPWGAAPHFEGVPFRRLVIESARYWLQEVGFDGLRIDAAHQLEPGGDPHILSEIAKIATALTPRAVLIAEDDRNDPESLARHGVSALWSDDFHHSLHVLLTAEKDGYYDGYSGTLPELANIINRNQLYEGQVFPATGKPRGKPAVDVPRERFVYTLQNHDQVGNRALGERITRLTDLERVRAATLLLLFLPATPLLFMGQEWGAESPFLYFTDYAEPLASEVTQGRRAEFAHFAAFASNPEAVPDPQGSEAFVHSQLRWEELELPEHAALLRLHRDALRLRREDRVLQHSNVCAAVHGEALWVERRGNEGSRLLIVNFSDSELQPDFAHRTAQLLLSSALEPGATLGSPVALAARSAAIFAIES